MGEVSIYKLDLSAGDFALATGGGPSWRSTSFGGSDTPITGYPEFGEMENIYRREGAGGSGQDVIDAYNTADYTIAWITLCGIGPLAYGQYDCRGGGAGKPLKVRWKQFFKSSSLAETGYGVALALTHGSGTPNGSGTGLFSTQVFLLVEMDRTSGATFQWNVIYRTLSAGVLTTAQLNAGLTGHSDTSDDAEHEMIVTLVPSTITGGFNGNGTSPGSATVGTDGSIDVSVDGISVLSGSSLKFVINNYATTNPEVYYGKSLWHGD